MDKQQFYMQVCAALIRRLGGEALISPEEFENPAASIMHRSEESGIRLKLVEYDGVA